MISTTSSIKVKSAAAPKTAIAALASAMGIIPIALVLVLLLGSAP